MGYCKRLADEEPRTFASLLGKVLPLQVNSSNPDTVLIELGRPVDEYTDEELTAIIAEGELRAANTDELEPHALQTSRME